MDLALGVELLYGITVGIVGTCITMRGVLRTSTVIRKDQSISERNRINRIYNMKLVLHEISPARADAPTSFGFISTAIIHYCDV